VPSAERALIAVGVFAEKLGLDLHHVPYKTTAQSIIDVATDIMHMQFAGVPPIVSLYEDPGARNCRQAAAPIDAACSDHGGSRNI
jgi:hypothetical protein